MFKAKAENKVNTPINIPAPIGGLDGVSALMGMPENRCVLLENWFPQTDGLEMRDGYVSHMTGSAEVVEKLHVYSSGTGAQTLWATTADGVFAATTAGAFGSAAIALTEGKTISTVIATGAGTYLFLVNGTDTVKTYDGSTWASVATFGSFASENASYVENYRQRLFFVKKNSLELQYLAANAISGSSTNYPLGAVFNKGGFIIAIGTWTLDGGSGSDDLFIALTNKGQIAVFSGNDPATWTPSGVYDIAEPIGPNCLYKYGGDILIITENGLFALSSVVQSTSIDRRPALSDTIKSLFRAAALSFKGNPGWEVISDPLKPMLLVNIPSTPQITQFVMNSQTKAWTVFKGWNARCFARMNGEVYFGTSTGVKRVSGNADEDTNITATMLQAYTRLRNAQNKKVELQKAYISNNNGFTYSLGVGNDFSDPRALATIVGSPATGVAIWGTSLFGEAVFSGATSIDQEWQTVPDAYSLWKAPYLQVVSRLAKIKYFGSDFLVLPGGNF